MMDCTSEFTTNKLFKSREELIQWAREVGKVNGFVIVTLRSDQGGKDNRTPRLTLGCERSGQYVSRNNKKDKKDEYRRNSGTKKCGCPFQLKGKKLATDDDWILTVVIGVHNHTAADHLEGHSFAGRLTSEEISLVIDQSKSLVQPKEILTTLKRRDKRNASTLRTIYNARQRLRLLEKGERSQMQQLMSNMKCTPIRNAAEYTYNAEMKLFHRRWKESDPTERMVLKRKLRELGLPQTTSLVEPSATTKTRGRPSKKTDKSTRRDSSLIEIVESEQGSYSLGMDSCTLDGLYPEMSSKQKRQPKEKVHRASSVKPVENAFPVALRPYILGVEDVKADGHCGFRAVASLLGYTEDGWVQVRKDLLQELEIHSSCYSELYGSENRVHELKHALGYFETHATRDRWMTMPDMGLIIASCYGVVLIHLSNGQCFTFLPLRTTHIPLTKCKEIAIGFTNYHFVKVFLKSGHPIPPIAPNWKRYCKPECSKWDASYIARIQQFRSILGSTVITREIEELD